MLRSAIDWHSTSLRILLEVSMLVAPAVDLRISRRCASSPGKNRAGFWVSGLLQDTATNSEVIVCAFRLRCQVAAFTASRVGLGSKCNAVLRALPSSPLY